MTTAPFDNPWWSRCVRLQLCGLGAGALGAALRWLPSGPTLMTVPAGLLLGGACAILLVFVRRPPTVILGIGVSVVVLVNLAAIPDERLAVVLGSDLTAAAFLLQVAGFATAPVAGVAALVVAARRVRRPSVVRVAQVVGLLLLAPVCAEYLSAYDDSTGDPRALLSGLVVFVPLYGCGALLVREVARRARLGWVGIVLLAAAFGILQAGVWDQSMFSPDYREIEGWDEDFGATLIPGIGLSAHHALAFVGGHVVASICAPIALIEATAPGSSRHPWLGRTNLVLTALAWAAASTAVLVWHLQTEEWHASPAQVGGAAAVALGAILVAWLGRPGPGAGTPRGTRPAPRVSTVFAVGLVLAILNDLIPPSWLGVAMQLVGYGLAATGLLVASRRPGWSVRHVAAAAAAALLVPGALAFTYNPLVGEVTGVAKYAHNVVMLGIVLGVAALALRGTRPERDIDRRVPTGAGRTAG